MAINVKVLERPIEEVSYMRATLKGMARTFKHLFEQKVTTQYPEQKESISRRWRGTHRMLTTETGKRYRLIMTNKSGDNHPVHLHRHTFEVTKVGDKPTAGVMKDTINMTRYSSVEVDFVADDPGPSLLHCHHQDHQDEGFMGLVTYL